MWLQRENWINNSFFIQHSIEWKIPILRKIKQILIQQNCNNKIIHRNKNALSNVVFDFEIPFSWLRNYILYNPMFYFSKSILGKESLKVITLKPQLVYYVCLHYLVQRTLLFTNGKNTPPKSTMISVWSFANGSNGIRIEFKLNLVFPSYWAWKFKIIT